MLTPTFSLSQSSQNLIVSIEAPYAKASDISIYFEDNEFLFYSKPYYLRLNLPGKVIYSEDPSHVSYDFDKSKFTITVPKATEGEVFEGLDLISQLLAPPKARKSGPLIEVIDGDDVEECDEEIDWSIDQIPTDSIQNELSISSQQCGFNNSHSSAVLKLESEASELFESVESLTLPMKERKEARLSKESSLFNEDHYIADLYDDKDIQSVIKFSPDWDKQLEEVPDSLNSCIDDTIQFTSKESERLRRLPRKEYILDKTQVQTTLLNLVDILYAYAYNKRTTEGENNVMSPWLIGKLSATLSWMETFVSLNEVAVTCIRRSLTYPLFRHFELSLTILEDVVKILKLGRKYVIKCLLEIHEMFCHTDPYYILNDLYVTDFCIWMQSKSGSSKNLLPLAERIEKVLLTKGDIKLDLVDIESIAAVAWMAHENPDTNRANGVSTVDTLSSEVSRLTIQAELEDESSSDSSDDSSSDSSESSSESDCSSCTDSDSSESSSSTVDDSDSDSWDSEDSADSNNSESCLLVSQKDCAL